MAESPQLPVRVPAELLDTLRAEAKRRGTTVSAITVEALVRALELGTVPESPKRGRPPLRTGGILTRVTGAVVDVVRDEARSWSGGLSKADQASGKHRKR